MYQFILNQWIAKKMTEDQVLFQVKKNRITKEEADMILATAQEPPKTALDYMIEQMNK